MKHKNSFCSFIFISLVIIIASDAQPVNVDQEITFDEMLSFYEKEKSLDETVHIKIECEIVIRYGSEKPEYFIAVADCANRKTNLTFYAPDIETIQAGEIKETETKGNERLFIKKEKDRTSLVDHNYRIYAIYHNVPACAFLAPTKSWIKSFLSSYAENRSSIVINKRDATNTYEITVKEMTKIDNVISGVLKLHIDTLDLSLKKVSFIGKSNIDKNHDGELDIVRININFLKSDVVPKDADAQKTEEHKHEEYVKVIIK